jgi:hypothetical protein
MVAFSPLNVAVRPAGTALTEDSIPRLLSKIPAWEATARSLDTFDYDGYNVTRPHTNLHRKLLYQPCKSGVTPPIR